MMKALVTGATGFTGNSLARTLYRQGHHVKVIVRDKSKIKTDAEFEPEVIEGDIRDSESVDRAVKGCQKIFHLAALFRTAGVQDHVYHDIHVAGTENLLQAALKNNISRFVHCSTVGVHGDIIYPPANEKTSFNPGDIYQKTKLEGEKTVHRFFRETGLPVSVIRPTAIYGPGDLRLLKLFKLAAMPVSPVIGSGNIYYHMIYIDDLVNAFILASEKKKAIGEAFIAGGKDATSLNQLIEIICEATHHSRLKCHLPAMPFQLAGSICEKICIPLKIEPPIYRRRVDFFTKSRFFTIDKAVTLLDFKPEVSLRTGIVKTASWYKDNSYL